MYIQEEIRLNPQRKNALRAMDRAIDDWRNFRLALPTISFAKELDIYLDGLTLEMRHVGGQHAPDSITIRVRESGVMFVGDCYYAADGTNDAEMVKTLLEADAELYISGHSDPRSREEMAALLNQDSPL
jgi:glyoxylase-like metal-dependent hydrolase (beta-lactamase superfamily II)